MLHIDCSLPSWRQVWRKRCNHSTLVVPSVPFLASPWADLVTLKMAAPSYHCTVSGAFVQLLPQKYVCVQLLILAIMQAWFLWIFLSISVVFSSRWRLLFPIWEPKQVLGFVAHCWNTNNFWKFSSILSTFWGSIMSKRKRYNFLAPSMFSREIFTNIFAPCSII